ncbi:MAG: OmpA family protein, partial [Proteobacteria bacterium]
YNLDLSRKRAEAIRTYLTTEEQIPNEKITAIGYGEERPVADNGNFQGRQANRRVEFLITR